MSPLAYHGRPKKRERKKGINGEVCGVLWSLLENWKRLEFLEIGNLVVVEKGRDIRKKEKGKEMIKRRYSL